jgi:hypothetical protein
VRDLDEHLLLTLLVLRNLLAVLLDRLGVGLVAVGLAGLREQDQRCRVRRLGREEQVEEDERIGVPAQRDDGRVQRDPGTDDERLADEELRRAEEAGDALGDAAEPVSAEGSVMLAGDPMSVGRGADAEPDYVSPTQ